MNDVKSDIVNIPRPVFFQDWWLDIVCNKTWTRYKAYHNQGINAECVISPNKKWGFRNIFNPLLTPYTGFYFDGQFTDQRKQLEVNIKLIKSLLKQLPNFSFFEINLLPEINNWLPFYQQGFLQTTRYTYRIQPQTEEECLKRMKPTLRNELKNKFSNITILNDMNIEECLQIIKSHYFNKNILTFYNEKVFKNIIEIGIRKGQCKIYGIKTNNLLTNFVLTIEDKTTVYNLINASLNTAKISNSPLIWTAIKDAMIQNKIFDFEGSMIDSVERYFRSFGGSLIPYNKITKVNGILPYIYHSIKNY